MLNHYVQTYIDLVRSGTVQVCQEQILLANYVEDVFRREDIYVDEEQAERYFGLLRHFPYGLLAWEKFVFVLHCCTYTAQGLPRWPILVLVVGRGAGKNGYLAFEDFCLLTPINGIKNYNIDIFATTEDQARGTFDDVWNLLEDNKKYFSLYFEWTKEKIRNKKTGSILRYHTSAPKSQDGGRPGKIDFDECHAYENTRLTEVAITGLGKKPHPRRTCISTMGDVRDGPLDRWVETGKKVLRRQQADNGWLYFFCWLDSDEEIMDPRKWEKANPSLHDPNRRELLQEIELEFADYKLDPAGNSAFSTKRMNRPKGNIETQVTSWENLKVASRPFPESLDLSGRTGVAGIDYASTQDFVAAGVLINANEIWYFFQHTWVCTQSSSLHRIQFPLHEAEARGELTFVDAPEIPPELPAQWLEEMRSKYNLLLCGIDHYRYTLMSKTLSEYGWNPAKKNGTLKLTYTPEQAMVAPIITSAFLNQKICWGDCMIMRWYTNNATRILDTRGNISFGKIDPKSRKTDGFMALVACFICAYHRMDELITCNQPIQLPDVWTY